MPTSMPMFFAFFLFSFINQRTNSLKMGQKGEWGRGKSPEEGEVTQVTTESIKRNTRETEIGFSPTNNNVRKIAAKKK